MTDPRIIRTVEELQALDPDTLLNLSDIDGYLVPASELLMSIRISDIHLTSLPAVVIRDGAGVRAARKALEEA